MSKDPMEYLKHIRDESAWLLSVINASLSEEDFIADETLKRAVVRSLEIIGEASKKIPDDVKIRLEFIDWKSMAGMRNRLVHDYMGVNYTIVWDVIKNKIPHLYQQITAVTGKE